jgi:hypothetical protein
MIPENIINAVTKFADENPDAYDDKYDFKEGAYWAYQNLIAPPQETGLREWVKATDKSLPPRFKNVMCYSSKGRYAISCVDATGSFDEFECEVDADEHFTHWMYLPTKPESSSPADKPEGEKPAFPLHVPDEIFKEASASAYLSPEVVYNEGTSSAYIQGFCVAHARFSAAAPLGDPAFVDWLDGEITKAEKQAEIENRKMEPYFAWEGRAKALEEAKEKFLAAATPPNNSGACRWVRASVDNLPDEHGAKKVAIRLNENYFEIGDRFSILRLLPLYRTVEYLEDLPSSPSNDKTE